MACNGRRPHMVFDCIMRPCSGVQPLQVGGDNYKVDDKMASIMFVDSCMIHFIMLQVAVFGMAVHCSGLDLEMGIIAVEARPATTRR